MESVEIRQCWAYNKDGQRCDMPAGHPGNHAIQQTWSDDECYSPIRHQLPPAPPVPPTPLIPPPVSDLSNCVACGHKHKNGECKCGCYEFIG